MAFLFWVLLLLLSTPLHSSDTSPSLTNVNGTVLNLDRLNFQATVNSFEYVLVDFQAPWCASCRRMDIQIHKAAEIISGLNLPVKIAQVNTEENACLAADYGVKQIPDLRWFHRGVHRSYYLGPEKAELMVNYIKNYVSSAAIVSVDNDSALVEFTQSAKPPLAVHIALGVDKFNLSTIAKKYKGIATFAHAENVSEEAMLRYGVHKLPAVVSLHPTQKETDVFYGEWTHLHYGDVELFLHQNLFPLVVPVDENYMELLAHRNSKLIILLIVEDSENAKSKSLVEKLKKFAPDNRDFLLFAYVGVKQWSAFTDMFDSILNQASLPVIVTWKYSNQGRQWDIVEWQRIPEAEEDTESAVREFIAPLVASQKIKRMKSRAYRILDMFKDKMFRIAVVTHFLSGFLFFLYKYLDRN